MITKNALASNTRNFAFYEGVYCGAFDEPPDTFEDIVAFFDWVTLTPDAEKLLWAAYQKGYRAGKKYQQMPVDTLRQLLRARIEEYTWSKKIMTKILNGWKDFVLLGITDKPGITDEEREKFYLLDWLSERTSAFYDDIDVIMYTL